MTDVNTVYNEYRTLYRPVCDPYEWVTNSGSHYEYYSITRVLYQYNISSEIPLMSDITEFYFPVLGEYRPLIVGRYFSDDKRRILLTSNVREWTSSEWARHQDLGVSWYRSDGTGFYKAATNRWPQ